MKKLITSGCGILAIGLITYFPSLSSTLAMEGNESDSYEYEYYYNDSEDYEGDSMPDSIASLTANPIDDDITADAFRLPVKIDTEAESLTVFVNKEYSLPSSYVPKELTLPDVKFFGPDEDNKRYMRKEAASALEDMFRAAGEDGRILYGVSAYRSYARQADIYTKNVRQRGSDATNKVSAIPGHSEHQTGLAIDISCKKLNGALSERFAYTSEGQWVEDNCYRYGFIIRYPKDREDITGYSYEPWHIRYVGVQTATYIHENGLTLEEYFNYTPDPDMCSDIVSDAATAEKVTAYNTPKPKVKPTAAPADTSAKKVTAKKHEDRTDTDKTDVQTSDKPAVTTAPDSGPDNSPEPADNAEITDELSPTAAPYSPDESPDSVPAADNQEYEY